ncbi:MAG: hypothetical protein IPL26_27045 [Leptospiraceae bacterium]|nr:hypothetical protein [Leptospiraceae bacterium]
MKFFNIGFLLAGLANIGGILIFSKFFTNTAMAEASPVVMSNFGQLMIIVWGFAYISVMNSYNSVPWLSLLFAVEKIIYVITWIVWFQNNDLTLLYAKDLFAGIFYTVYGLNDFISMLFFGWTFWFTRSNPNV